MSSQQSFSHQNQAFNSQTNPTMTRKSRYDINSRQAHRHNPQPRSPKRFPKIFGTFSICEDPTDARFVRLKANFSVNNVGNIPEYSRGAPSVAEAIRLLGSEIEYWILQQNAF